MKSLADGPGVREESGRRDFKTFLLYDDWSFLMELHVFYFHFLIP